MVLLGALTAFAPLSIDMYLPSLPTIARAFGTSTGAAQGTLAAFLAGLAIGQFFYGPASDRWGRRGPILAGTVLYVAATVACALSTSIEMLTIARFVQAIGGSAGAVVARAIVRDRFNHRELGADAVDADADLGPRPGARAAAGQPAADHRRLAASFWLVAAIGSVVLVAAALRLAGEPVGRDPPAGAGRAPVARLCRPCSAMANWWASSSPGR